MTDQTTEALIAEARGAIDRSFHNSCQGRHADLLHRLADALEAAEKRAVEAEQELQVAEDQANNLAGDLAQAERARDSAMASYKDYMTLHRKAAELSAVMEKARLIVDRVPDGFWVDEVYELDNILNSVTAPADALREVKAAVWAEGHDAGWEDRNQDALAGWMPSDSYESEAVNPYRKEQP